MSRPRLAGVHQAPGWEEKALLARAAERGVEVLALSTARLVLGPEPAAPPETIFLVRTASYFQSLAVARWLEGHGHPVVNSSHDLALCGDKLETDHWLRRNHLPAIPSVTLFGPEGLAAAGERLGWPLVAKPPIGGGGRLVQRLDGPRELAQHWELVEAYAPASHRVLYLQPLLDVRRDLRVLLLAGRVLAAVERRNPGRLARNVASGGVAEPAELGSRAEEVAAEIGRRLPDAFLGVDLLETTDGAVHVCELNAVCRFRATAEATGVEVAEALVDHALARGAGRSLRPVA